LGVKFYPKPKGDYFKSVISHGLVIIKRGTCLNRLYLVILFALCLFSVLAPITVLGDPVYSGGLRVEGAHIVSEGAYFRFWICNYEDYNVSVTIDDGITYYLPKRYNTTNSNFTYNVIAPQVNLLFEKVHYFFKVNVTGVDYNSHPWFRTHFPYTIDYPVYVLDSSFIILLDYLVPAIIVIATVLVVVTAILVRRRKKKLV